MLCFQVVIVSGSVFSELSLVHEGPKTSSFVHTVRLYHGPKGKAGIFRFDCDTLCMNDILRSLIVLMLFFKVPR